jgi:NADP-dependent 3-hydroxy acid dehydrogenase YdfG
MDLRLEANQPLVTVSTAGIGFAIAGALVKEGASVVVNGRTEQRVKAALKQLQHPELAARWKA